MSSCTAAVAMMPLKGTLINESEKSYKNIVKYTILKYKLKFNLCINNIMSFLHSALNKNIYLLNLMFIPNMVNAHGMAVTETVLINWWIILGLNFIIFVALFFCDKIIVPFFYLCTFLAML
ncbi:hypothetical protein DRM22_23385, partial [Salmonella enterica subsp. enterica serovar Glostrup]|nr:hypothetical protein [Salmonella enterica subsp. enterica serovar Glostrup]